MSTPGAASDNSSWRDDALCRQVDPELFFPEPGGSTAKARAICIKCEVREPCLQLALDRGEPGVWGGTSKNQRQAIRRTRTPARR
ncbi:WhiB family transcriptional regulator [Streptomyces sp. NPDC093111]|uniref:WhiB family transcriptional regulator n=1 Tax=Streptomyces sp. NPDC093111 TaxID=3154978 RepID=UPI00344379AB